MSIYIYMTGINVNDSAMMYLTLHYWLVSGFEIHDWV